jgi:hypothetical protein
LVDDDDDVWDFFRKICWTPSLMLKDEKRMSGILQIFQSVEIELGFQIFWQLAFNFAAWTLMISTEFVN